MKNEQVLKAKLKWHVSIKASGTSSEGVTVNLDGAEDIDLPRELTWKAVDGAGFYEVFIHDIWNNDRLIYTSKLLTEPRVVLPANLLQPGGYYRWIINARDVNEDIRLGDFDSGSMSRMATFSVRP